MTLPEIMKLGVNRARFTMEQNIGGPFGAVIAKDDKVIAVASNTVLRDNDPTCHAEMNAIRIAAKELGTYDLSGCTLYTTAMCCPMCLSATIWSNIKTVYYGCTAEDADKIGFRDDFMYKFIEDKCNDADVLELIPAEHDECIKLFEEYAANSKTIY